MIALYLACWARIWKVWASQVKIPAVAFYNHRKSSELGLSSVWDDISGTNFGRGYGENVSVGWQVKRHVNSRSAETIMGSFPRI